MAVRDVPVSPRRSASSHSPTPRGRPRWRGSFIPLLVFLGVLFGPGGLFTAFAPLAHAAPTFAHPTALTPTTQDRALAAQAAVWGHTPQTPLQPLASYWAAGPGTTPPGDLIPRQVIVPQPNVTGSVTLSASTATTLATSDGRFTLDIPAGALSASDLAAVGGPLTLKVTQLAGAVGGGASGHLSLGTYLIELLGPRGRMNGIKFRQPVTLSLHYAPGETAGFVNYGVVIHLESDVSTRTASVLTAPPATLPLLESVRTTHQASTHTVSGRSVLSPLPMTGAMVATFNTSAPQANWPTVQDFQVDINAGALQYSYPLDLPPGPGGFVPNLNLSYSSASVNENHGVQTSAPWVGEGWALDLGSISWSQIDENSGCQQAAPPPPYNPNCGAHNWQNVWTISASGIGGALIPPDVTVATGPYSGTNTVTPTPLQWVTAPESHAKIWEITCTTTDLQNNAWQHPCWRVWLPSGEMLEFGATNDSVEYYVDGTAKKYIYAWKVDALVDPHGNQIHVSYQQYTAQYPGTNQPYVRDAELATVTYDSPSCLNTSTICTPGGTAPNKWTPLVQVVFDSATKPTRLTGGDPSCQTWSSTTTRCDTATDYSGGLPGPQVTSVAVLNDIQVKVDPTGTGTYQLLRAYQFSYEQTAQISGLMDTISGEYENVAGYLDLTKIQQFGTDWTNNCTTCASWPAMQFSYTGAHRTTYVCFTPGDFPCTDDSVLQERYMDPAYISPQLANGDYLCVVWVSFGGCVRYSWSETFNQRYLTEADNGLGWQETFTWAEGHMNVVGVPSGRSVTNPFSCTTSDENSNPCWKADEQHWSRILLASRDAKIQRNTAGGPTITVADHWAYTYTMASVNPANAWCVSGVCPVIWDFGNVNDGDYLDYYNAEYRGFSKVHVVQQEVDTGGGSCVTACTVSVTDHYFITTQGWGVWDTTEVSTKQGCWNAQGSPVQYLCPTSPSWSSSNMPAGRETQLDEFASDGTTLLKRTTTTYTLNCGPVGDPTTPPPAQFDSNCGPARLAAATTCW